MRKRLPIIIIILVVAIGAGIWLARRHSLDSRNQALVLYGNVDIREVNLGFRVPGRLQEVLRDEGDEIKAGETIARLDDQPYRHDVAQARAQAGSLQARLELLQAGNRPQEI